MHTTMVAAWYTYAHTPTNGPHPQSGQIPILIFHCHGDVLLMATRLCVEFHIQALCFIFVMLT